VRDTEFAFFFTEGSFFFFSKLNLMFKGLSCVVSTNILGIIVAMMLGHQQAILCSFDYKNLWKTYSQCYGMLKLDSEVGVNIRIPSRTSFVSTNQWHCYHIRHYCGTNKSRTYLEYCIKVALSSHYW